MSLIAANAPNEATGDGYDLTNLLDPQVLKKIAAQFGTTDEDKRAAQSAAMWALGAGILGTPGSLGHSIGAGAAMALPAYQNTIRDLQQQRMQNIQQASQLFGVARQQAIFNSIAPYLKQIGQTGGIAPPGPATSGGLLSPNTPLTGGEMGASTSATGLPVSQAGGIPLTPPPPPPQGGGGPNYRGTVPLEAIAFTMAGFPEVGKLMFEGSQGKVSRQGLITDASGRPRMQVLPTGTLYFNPDGTPGQFMPNPGNVTAAEAARQAEISRATETEKARYGDVGVPVSTGGTVPISRLAWAQSQNAFGPSPAGPAAPPGPAPVAPPGAPRGITLNLQNAPPEQAIAALRDAIAAAGGQGSAVPTPTPVSAPQKAPGLPMGGPPAGKLFFDDIPPYHAPAAVVGRPQSTQEAAFANKVASNSFDVLNDVNSRGATAAANLANFQAMKTLSDEVGKTGVTTPALVKAGQIAIALGVAPDTVAELTKAGVPPAEAFSKLLAISAGQALKQNVSANRPTQFEYSVFLNATPNLGMTKAGRDAALAIMMGSAKHAMAEQQAADAWARTHNRDMTDFPAWFTRTNAPDKYLPSGDQLRSIVGGGTAKSGQFQEGQVYVDAQGNKAKYSGGKWVPQ